MEKLPKAAPAAEHLKNYVQEVLGAFQEGAGVNNGLPLPMTFELAVKSIWHEIDRVFYTAWPKDTTRRVTMRVQGKRPATCLLRLINGYGTWTMRCTSRGGGGEGEPTVVAHLVGTLSGRTPAPVLLIALLDALAADLWSVSDVTLGTL